MIALLFRNETIHSVDTLFGVNIFFLCLQGSANIYGSVMIFRLKDIILGIEETCILKAMPKKTDKIQALFVASRLYKEKYTISTLNVKLRISLIEQSVMVAMARANAVTQFGTESLAPISEKDHYIANIKYCCQFCLGCLLKLMLAHLTMDIAKALNCFDKDEFTCEFKYAGGRSQVQLIMSIHLANPEPPADSPLKLYCMS
ncbi:DNA ligase [Nephila pilipes]|uniref:DNA ligase n=1 Tax=Nephila pilipes TaxID=299642 RepID=A0A8X6MC37_NEPPI|nr:DNA ligase [Nephila pilipes]